MASVVATADHNTPTKDWDRGIQDPISRTQVETLDANIKEHGAKAYFPFLDRRQGIVHVIGPEQGATLPGMTVVCGDSHTSTHGAFAALAFGIGTSEVEHVLATQCLLIKKAKSMLIRVDGRLPPGVTAKDLALTIIGRIGTAGGTGHAIEFAGEAVRALSMEGAHDALQHVDRGWRARRHGRRRRRARSTTSRAARSRPTGELWDRAVAHWRTLATDDGAALRHHARVRRRGSPPAGHLGHVAGNGGRDRGSCARPRPRAGLDRGARASSAHCRTWASTPNTPMTHIHVDKVFIGSCTNSRIEDLRAAAAVARGRRVAGSVKLALVVPGSGLVKAQAEAEGLDRVFRDAGFEWREPGCSMCLAMNDDRLEPGERCASTSNRNFEGRQGAGGRTHLVSPRWLRRRIAGISSTCVGWIRDGRRRRLPSLWPSPLRSQLQHRRGRGKDIKAGGQAIERPPKGSKTY